MSKKVNFLNKLKTNIKHFAGTDNVDYQNMMLLLEDKKRQIKTTIT